MATFRIEFQNMSRLKDREVKLLINDALNTKNLSICENADQLTEITKKGDPEWTTCIDDMTDISIKIAKVIFYIKSEQFEYTQCFLNGRFEEATY